MADIERGVDGNGGRDVKSSKPSNRSNALPSSVPQAVGSFPIKGMGNESANGGSVTNGTPMNMKVFGYNGKTGTDGFSLKEARRKKA